MRIVPLLIVLSALGISATGCSTCKSWFGSKGDTCAAPAPQPYYPGMPGPVVTQMPVVADPGYAGYRP